jgi:hypothetical protein
MFILLEVVLLGKRVKVADIFLVSTEFQCVCIYVILNVVQCWLPVSNVV